ncbi:PREDICTED: multiple organellar RNA editing factor [Prunus dulcis]|uniref:PREDICTED: multiple organellar RNA editing factor n=1 Tax=Prunus dulcis TaxID=3755 RepID=A0A5E4F114_PRUDU|nr:multiple organellar RNA editing factor 7, mitochondrial isoform X2 [Prunus dulcis]VVA20739.1 PREDICTED: multiple organellar RNA editing factor [Prunus dulcis]
MRSSIVRNPLSLTARFSSLPSFPSSRFSSSSAPTSSAAADSSAATQCSGLTRLASLVDGCDYEHWLVVMEPPKGYPLRDEIINGYIQTLATALGSAEKAKKSIYSVSTKYYYAFGCKVPENLTFKIKYLPNVKWVLPDSYLCHGENDYGGEPLVDGVVIPYDQKYHADWVCDENDTTV